jgi:hypothetical protein
MTPMRISLIPLLTLITHVACQRFILPPAFSPIVTTCGTGATTVNDQPTLNAWKQQNPNCTTFNGTLALHGNVSELNPLSALVTITSLVIDGTKVSSMKGLNALQAASLSIVNNNQLVSLYGLALTRIEGPLLIANNPALNSIAGLASVTSITPRPKSNDGLIITNCPLLTSLRGLENLANYGTALVLSDLPSLLDIDDIGAGPYFVQNITLNGLTGLSSITPLTAFKALESTGLALTISNTLILSSLDGISTRVNVSKSQFRT